MHTRDKNRRRVPLQVESLEGKTLLSGVSPMAHPTVAAIVAAQATITGTLTGPYSSVHAPFFAYIQSYNTTGTLTGVGSTHLAGTLFVRPSTPAGRFVGQFLVLNSGGSMILNVFASGATGIYSYHVAIANGSDAGFKGDMGTLTITQMPTFSVPYFTDGQSTVTFS